MAVLEDLRVGRKAVVGGVGQRHSALAGAVGRMQPGLAAPWAMVAVGVVEHLPLLAAMGALDF